MARTSSSWARPAALVAVITLALTGAVIVRLHTGRPTQTVVALDLPADDGGVQPARFGADDLAVTDVVWTSWTPERAEGTGNLNARGQSSYPIAFTLASPVYACGRYFFSLATWRRTAGGSDTGVLALTPHVRRDGSGPCP